MQPALDYVRANPILLAALWMLVSAAITALFGPHTPEQLASYPAWLVKVLHLTGALGIDVPKLLAIIRGRYLFIGMVFVLILVGCQEAQHAAADGAYSAKQLACVQDAGSRAEADTCRKNVDAEFGITDGGAP